MKLPDGLRPVRVPTVPAALQLTLHALVIVYLSSLFARDEIGYNWVFEGVIVNVALGLCAVLCLWRSWRVRHDRAAFASIGIGCLLYTAGNTAYVSHVQYLDPIPFPNVADIGYLGIYPFLVVAVLLLGRSDVKGRQIAVWLDGLVGVLGIAAVGSALVLHTTLENISGDFGSLAVGAAYPLGDLLVLSMIVGVLTLKGRRPDRRWAALAGGLTIFVFADIVYLLRLSTDSYAQGTFLDALWVVGLGVLSMSAWQPTQHRDDAEPISGAGPLAVTIVSSLLAVAVLVAASTIDVPGYAVGFSAATLLAALLRGVVAFHQLGHLVEARHHATTDDLTGLANRREFTGFLDRTLATTSSDLRCAVLLVDLDRFKDVNDLFGHQMGDRLLQQIGPALSPVLRQGDMLARLGGDEFGILLPGAGKDAAVQTARRVCDALLVPFVVDDVTLRIAGSVGIALWPADSDNAEDLFQCADVAMYAAKAHRSGVEVYDVEHGADGRNRLIVAREIRTAVASSDQFVLHYQPKLNLHSGLITGVEALVRWHHPQRGLLYPDSFLAVAEQTGSLRALTAKVLSMAIAQCRQWQLDGLDLTMAVNLSAADLSDDHLVNEIAVMLARANVPTDALQLEITETTLMADPQRAIGTLHALRSLGVTLSIDDYGTGFSSLAYLRDLPVQELKIDRAFITDLREHSSDAAIVRSTIDLVHALGFEVVAEGVESDDVLTLLRRYGCDTAQGFHVCTPKPANDLTAWLRNHPTRTRAAMYLADSPDLAFPDLGDSW